MAPSIRTVIYLVSDLARAKAVFGALLGAAPVMDVTSPVPGRSVAPDADREDGAAAGESRRVRRGAQSA